MLFKSIFPLLFVVFISGCATHTQIPLERLPNDVKTQFTFDYKIESVNKAELWKRARDYFAGTYGDSRSVFRVMDETDGTIIGKASSSWLIRSSAYTITCYTDYHVRFVAKDNKARLQLEIIKGIPAGTECIGWPLPSKQGYDEVVKSFQANSRSLENALKGAGSSNDFKNL